MNITLTGATGFIGRRLLAQLLEEGHTVCALGRRRSRDIPSEVVFFEWDSATQEAPREGLAEAGAVIHLAGEPVAQRWTEDAKRRIRESRTTGTRNLVAALLKLPQPPSILISGSAIGYYGTRDDEVLDESSPPGQGFLPDVCVEWERAAEGAGKAGTRVVKLRTGIVLGAGGGALQQMLPPFKMGAGGRLGSGRQWMSWIHLDDLTSLIRFALDREELSGAVNGVSPNPVTNAEFTHALAGVLGRPALLPVPKLALKVLYGEMADVLFSSQRVLPRAAQSAGFQFKHPDLQEALRDVLGQAGARHGTA